MMQKRFRRCHSGAPFDFVFRGSGVVTLQKVLQELSNSLSLTMVNQCYVAPSGSGSQEACLGESASVLSFERIFLYSMLSWRIYIKGPNSVVKMLELALNKQMLGLVRSVGSGSSRL